LGENVEEVRNLIRIRVFREIDFQFTDRRLNGSQRFQILRVHARREEEFKSKFCGEGETGQEGSNCVGRELDRAGIDTGATEIR